MDQLQVPELKEQQDAEWQAWSQWSACSKTCLGGIGLKGQRTRRRGCRDELNNGKTCAELARTSDATETEACNTSPCPINGGWREWDDERNNGKTCAELATTSFLLFPPNPIRSEGRDPHITKFHVTSKIQLRFASTEVLSHMWNPSSQPQEVTFEIRLPEKAFIHGFSMTVSLDRIILRGDQIEGCRWMGKSMWQQLKPRPRQERPTSLRGRSV